MRVMTLALMAVSLNLCAATVGSGVTDTEHRPVSDFTKIELEGVGSLIVTHADKPALSVKADDNVIGELATTVEGKTLFLRPLSTIRPKTPIEYRVSVKNLKEIEVQGAAEIKSNGAIEVDELSIKIEGAAKADLTIQGKALEVEIDGAGQLTVAGEVEHQEVEIDGAGKYHALGLKTKETELEINGTGKAQVYATEKLDVDLNGAGSVTYKGNPKVTQKIRGIGTVSQV